MSHLSHKLRWNYLDINNEKSREHFSQLFVRTMEQFKSTSKDKPNYYIPEWPTEKEENFDIDHDVTLYEMYEIQSKCGIITYLIHNYLELNLLLTNQSQSIDQLILVPIIDNYST